MTKDAIRDEVRARRRALSPEAAARIRAAVVAQLEAREDVRRLTAAAPVAVYLASPREIDLRPYIATLIARGATVVAPRWNGAAYDLAVLEGFGAEHVRPGPLHIDEPRSARLVSPDAVRLWLIPGLAFTRSGQRIGYGGGWYDRLLAAASPEALRLGIAGAFQIYPEDGFPVEGHDSRLDDVLVGA